MVSNASEDFPLPESPVNTTSLSRGISRSMFFRLFSFAPLMNISFIFRYADGVRAVGSFQFLYLLFQFVHFVAEFDGALEIQRRGRGFHQSFEPFDFLNQVLR